MAANRCTNREGASTSRLNRKGIRYGTFIWAQSSSSLSHNFPPSFLYSPFTYFIVRVDRPMPSTWRIRGRLLLANGVRLKSNESVFFKFYSHGCTLSVLCELQVDLNYSGTIFLSFILHLLNFNLLLDLKS